MTREELLCIMFNELEALQAEALIDLSLELAPETSFESLRLSSLDVLQLALTLEDKLHVSLGVGDFPNSSSLLDIADHILELKQQSPKTIR